MNIIGWILLVVGGILFYGAKIIYLKKSKEKSTQASKTQNSSVDKDNKYLFVLRIVGGVMVIAGGVLIMFIR